VKTVYWVTPNLLAGRPGPKESPWDLEEIWAGGLRTIVSLVRVNGTAIQAAGFRHYQVSLHGGLAFFPLLRHRLVWRMLPQRGMEEPLIIVLNRSAECETRTLLQAT